MSGDAVVPETEGSTWTATHAISAHGRPAATGSVPRWLGLYHAKDDDRIWGPKWPGCWGWTVNLARSGGLAILAGLAVAVGLVVAAHLLRALAEV